MAAAGFLADMQLQNIATGLEIHVSSALPLPERSIVLEIQALGNTKNQKSELGWVSGGDGRQDVRC